MQKKLLLFIGIPLGLILVTGTAAYFLVKAQIPKIPVYLQAALKQKEIELTFARADSGASGLSLRFQGASLTGQPLPYEVKTKAINAKLGFRLWPLVVFELKIESPEVVTNTSYKPHAPEANAAPTPPLVLKLATLLTPLVQVKVQVDEASFEEKGMRGLSLVSTIESLKLSGNGLEKAKITHSLKLTTLASQAWFTGLEWKGTSFLRYPNLEADDHQLLFGPFPLRVGAKYHLKDQRWLAEISLPQTTITSRRQFLAGEGYPWLSDLSGDLGMKVNAQGIGGDPATMNLEGSLVAKGIKVSLQHPNAKGVLLTEIDVKFAKAPLLEVQGTAKLDGTGLELIHENLFHKPSSIPLLAEAQFNSHNGEFTLSGLQTKFHTLTASLEGKGKLEPQVSGAFQFQIARTDLSGWEKFFPQYTAIRTQGSLEAKGSFDGPLQDWRAADLHIEVQAKDVRIPILKEWLPNKELQITGLPHINSSTTLDLASGAIRTLATETIIDLKDADVQYSDVFKKPKGTVFETNLSVQSTSNRAEIKRGDLALGPFKVRLKGRIEDFAQPRANLKFDTDRMDLPRLLGFTQNLALKGLTNARGQLSAQGTITGPLTAKNSPPQVEGSAQFSKIGFDYEVESSKKKIKALDLTGPLVFTNKSLLVKQMKLSFPGTDALLDLSVRDFENPVVAFSLGASRFQAKDFYEVTSGTGPSGGVPIPVTAKAGTETEPDFRANPYLKKLRLSGNIRMQNVDLGYTKTDLLTARIDYDHLLLKLSPVTMNSFGGRVTSNTEWDGRAQVPKTKQSLKVEGVDANQFITSYAASGADVVSGKLNTELEVTFTGMTAEEIKRSLTGDGAFSLVEGNLKSIRFTQKPMEALKRIPFIAKGITKTDWEEKFNDITGKYQIENGQVRFSNMVLRASAFEIFSPEASVDFDANLKAKAIWYPKESMIPSSVSEVFRDDQGKPSVPLAISGPLRSPSVVPDMGVLEPRLKAYAAKKIEAEKNRAVSGVKDKAQQEIEKKIKGGIGNIFK